MMLIDSSTFFLRQAVSQGCGQTLPHTEGSGMESRMAASDSPNR